jgi:hypothetical protein
MLRLCFRATALKVQGSVDERRVDQTMVGVTYELNTMDIGHFA